MFYSGSQFNWECIVNTHINWFHWNKSNFVQNIVNYKNIIRVITLWYYNNSEAKLQKFDNDSNYMEFQETVIEDRVIKSLLVANRFACQLIVSVKTDNPISFYNLTYEFIALPRVLQFHFVGYVYCVYFSRNHHVFSNFWSLCSRGGLTYYSVSMLFSICNTLIFYVMVYQYLHCF